MKCLILKVFALCVIGNFLFAGTVHVVKKDETLYSISRMYGTTVELIKKENSLSGNNLKVGQQIKIPDSPSDKTSVASASSKSSLGTDGADGTYTVKKGDTWYAIARNHSLSVAELLSLNGATEKTALKIGQKVTVKKPVSVVSPSAAAPAEKAAASKTRGADENGTYIVQKGDSLLSIAKDFGLTYSEIMAMNNLTEKTSSLKVGQKLTVAAKTPALGDNDPRTYSSKKGDTSLVWPVHTTDVTYVSGKVSGVNLSAKSDEAVTAIMDGTVLFSGSYRGFGNVVFIQSKTGHIYAYTGLGTISAEKGQYVQTGKKIGTAGLDTYSKQPQISLMVFQNGNPIDPAKAPRG